MIWARVKYSNPLGDPVEEIVDFVDEAPNVDQNLLAPGKPRILPVETEEEECDPVSQVLEGPTWEVEESRVVRRFTARAKTSEEIAVMATAKSDEIEDVFVQLFNAPITFTVNGEDYLFHADKDARENIQGVLQMYNEVERLGGSLPDPRPWTPKDAAAPIQITRAELAMLGVAIGARKDALYTIKKTRQAAVAAMTDPADIHAVNAEEGWA